MNGTVAGGGAERVAARSAPGAPRRRYGLGWRSVRFLTSQSVERVIALAAGEASASAHPSPGVMVTASSMTISAAPPAPVCWVMVALLAWPAVAV